MFHIKSNGIVLVLAFRVILKVDRNQLCFTEPGHVNRVGYRYTARRGRYDCRFELFLLFAQKHTLLENYYVSNLKCSDFKIKIKFLIKVMSRD